MGKIIIGVVSVIIFLPSILVGQIPVPAPVADKEIRDPSSIRSRSLELERVKRDADTTVLIEGDRTIDFAEVKKDFENIQKLQTAIVSAYTTGRTIGYREISEYALEMNQSSLRLKLNLFPLSGKKVEPKKEIAETRISAGFREIIVDLDDNIGSFAGSSMFQNLRLIDPAVYQKTRLDLEQIIKLSSALNRLADQWAKIDD